MTTPNNSDRWVLRTNGLIVCRDCYFVRADHGPGMKCPDRRVEKEQLEAQVGSLTLQLTSARQLAARRLEVSESKLAENARELRRDMESIRDRINDGDSSIDWRATINSIVVRALNRTAYLAESAPPYGGDPTPMEMPVDAYPPVADGDSTSPPPDEFKHRTRGELVAEIYDLRCSMGIERRQTISSAETIVQLRAERDRLAESAKFLLAERDRERQAHHASEYRLSKEPDELRQQLTDRDRERDQWRKAFDDSVAEQHQTQQQLAAAQGELSRTRREVVQHTEACAERELQRQLAKATGQVAALRARVSTHFDLYPSHTWHKPADCDTCQLLADTTTAADQHDRDVRDATITEFASLFKETMRLDLPNPEDHMAKAVKARDAGIRAPLEEKIVRLEEQLKSAGGRLTAFMLRDGVDAETRDRDVRAPLEAEVERLRSVLFAPLDERIASLTASLRACGLAVESAFNMLPKFQSRHYPLLEQVRVDPNVVAALANAPGSRG